MKKHVSQALARGVCVAGAVGMFALGHPVPACWLVAAAIMVVLFG